MLNNQRMLKGIRRHLYRTREVTIPGFQALIVAKLKSTVRHMAGKHDLIPRFRRADMVK